MGVMRFQIHPASLLEDWPELNRAYISGFDGRVFASRIELEGSVLACRRQNADSGKLHVVFPVPNFGRCIVSTSSLPEREEPFLLLVELARGKLSQVRDQLAAWEMAGMTVPEEFHQIRRKSQACFGKAVASQEDPVSASELAQQSLELSFQAAQLLCQGYTAQRLAVRKARAQRLPASLGCGLGMTPPNEAWSDEFRQVFTAASVPIEWRHIEPEEGEYQWDINDAQVDWCEEHRLLMTGGPLLDLSLHGVPAWLKNWEHDFLNLQSFFCDFVETAITRYAGRIRYWEVSARGNSGGGLNLNEENRLSLTARAFEIARQVNEDQQLLIRVDQPWGGYQSKGDHRLSPLQYVDALMRAGVGVSGVNLEIGVGYRARSSSYRDMLDFSRLIDLWSCLGLPLHVTLAFPSQSVDDSRADPDLQIDNRPDNNRWTPEAQADFVSNYLPMLMAKQVVVGIFWSHFSDGHPHDFPQAGLIDAFGTPKPAFGKIQEYRQEYWQNHD